MTFEKRTANNKEDFMWHVVPSMKSPVALNSVTWPYSMHLPPLFVIHEQPYFSTIWWFSGNLLVFFYILICFSFISMMGLHVFGWFLNFLSILFPSRQSGYFRMSKISLIIFFSHIRHLPAPGSLVKFQLYTWSLSYKQDRYGNQNL